MIMSSKSIKADEITSEFDDAEIHQNHERNPGWFLIATYVVVSAFCIYYLFTYWNWKSDYELTQQKAKGTIASPAP
jgi:hypothetical protein